MQGIALATRKAKAYRVDGSTWREEARARAAEHGLGSEELSALRTQRGVGTSVIDLAAIMTRLSGPQGLTATHNTFVRRHALAEIAGAFTQGAPIADLEDASSQYLTDDTVASVGPAAGEERRYTTYDLLAREREIVDGARRRRDTHAAVLPAALVDEVIAAQPVALNNDQAAAVRAITSDGHGVDTVNALAGTGKTTMIGAVACAYRQAGWCVIGAAPTARAARQLRDIAGINASTMHSVRDDRRR